MLGNLQLGAVPIGSVWQTPAAGGVSYTLTADKATYTLTAQAGGLLLGRLMPAAQQTYTLTAQSGGFLLGHVLSAEPAAYALTGQAATLSTTGVVVVATPPAAPALPRFIVDYVDPQAKARRRVDDLVREIEDRLRPKPVETPRPPAIHGSAVLVGPVGSVSGRGRQINRGAANLVEDRFGRVESRGVSSDEAVELYALYLSSLAA